MKKKFINVFIVFVLLISLCGCTNDIKGSVTQNVENEINKSINNKLQKILKENNYIIIDVRTKQEYNQKHVVGAINIPYNEIDSNTNLDKNKTILVYCKSGGRSAIAYSTLKQLGYKVYDLGAFDNIDLKKE